MDATTGAAIDKQLNLCRLWIPGLVELHFGHSLALRDDGNDVEGDRPSHVIWSRHVSGSALEEYLFHPEHLALSALLKRQARRPAVALDSYHRGKL